MAWPPTTTEILDLAEGGVYMRADRFRFDLEDPHGRALGTLSPDLDQTPTLTNDSSRSIFRSVRNLRLPASETVDINTLRDRCRIWMILQNGAELPLGSYVWADATHPLREWGAEQHSVLSDLTELLDEERGRTSGSKKGDNLILRARQFATIAGGWPDDEIDFVASATTVGVAPLMWTPSDHILAIINEHLDLAGYFPAHTNHDSQLVYRPMPNNLDILAPDLIYQRGGRVIRDSRTQSDDSLRAPNEYVVYEQSGEGPPIIGVYTIPDSAPHSAFRRDRVIRHVESVQGLASAVAATKAARDLAFKDPRNTFDWQTWSSPLDPRHDTYSIIAIDDVNYLEVAWEMQLRPGGIMTHQARRPYFD